MSASCLASFAFETVTAAEACTDPSELDQIIGRAFDRLGANVYVGIEARSGLEGPAVRISFGRTCPAWESHYFEAGHAAHDPMVGHILTSLDVLYWSDLTSGERRLTRRERQVFEEARAFGFSEGLAVPLHHPGGGVSAVLLMGEALDGRDPAERHAARMISHAFSRAARRLRLAQRCDEAEGTHLSRRETEALYWARRGASNKAIADTMRISHNTVADYMHSARLKLGVTRRVAVAERASELGLLPAYLPRESHS